MKKKGKELQRKNKELKEKLEKLNQKLELLTERESSQIENHLRREEALKKQIEKAQGDIFSVQGVLLGFRERCSRKIEELEFEMKNLKENYKASLMELTEIERERDYLKKDVLHLSDYSYQMEMMVESLKEQQGTKRENKKESPVALKKESTAVFLKEGRGLSTDETPKNVRKTRGKAEKESGIVLEESGEMREKTQRSEEVAKKLEKENEMLRKELKEVKDKMNGELVESMLKANARVLSKKSMGNDGKMAAEREEETIERGERSLMELNKLKEHLNSMLRNSTANLQNK